MQRVVSVLFLLQVSFFCSAQTFDYFSNCDRINDILIGEDRIWVATNGGLLELDSEAKLIKKHTILDGINTTKVAKVVANEEGQVYLITDSYQRGIQYLKEGKWITYQWKNRSSGIQLIYSNGLFGVVDRAKDNIHLQLNGKKEVYKFGKNIRGRVLNTVAFDGAGNLWNCFNNGLVRFDKNKHKKVYPFIEEAYRNAEHLLIDKNGIAWSRSTNPEDSWFYYHQEGDSMQQCISNDCNRIIAGKIAFGDSKQNLWFSDKMANNLYQYDGRGWTKHKIPLLDVVQSYENQKGKDLIVTGKGDQEGNIWLGSNNGNLYKYNGTEWTFYDLSDPKGLLQDEEMSFKGVLSDKDGNLWLTGKDFAAKYNLETKKATGFSRDIFDLEGFSNYMFQPESILTDSEGSIYINAQKGIFKFDVHRQKWEYGMGQYTIPYMNFDEKNNKISYLTTDGFLIEEFESGELSYEKVADIRNKYGPSFKQVLWDSKGGCWISKEAELIYINGKNKQTFTKDNSPFKESIPDVLYEASSGQIWAGFDEGISFWNGKEWRIFTAEEIDIQVNAQDFNPSLFVEDTAGMIYIGYRGELLKWDGKTWSVETKIKEYKYTGTNGRLFVDSENRLWVFGIENKIYKCENLRCKPVFEDVHLRYKHVFEDKNGGIWMLLEKGGILRYQD